MALVCYKNGSLTRQEIRDLKAERSWESFDSKLKSTPAGNNGSIGFYFKDVEITPPGAHGFFRFDKDDNLVTEFDDPATEVRAVVEGQCLSMRSHASKIGMDKFASILATGGASSNENLTKVLADVFGVPVFIAETANSASLGAALRALHGWKCKQEGKFVPFRYCYFTCHLLSSLLLVPPIMRILSLASQRGERPFASVQQSARPGHVCARKVHHHAPTLLQT